MSPGDDCGEEPGADLDLLQWSDALDFDNYTRQAVVSPVNTACLQTFLSGVSVFAA